MGIEVKNKTKLKKSEQSYTLLQVFLYSWYIKSGIRSKVARGQHMDYLKRLREKIYQKSGFVQNDNALSIRI